MPPDAFTASPSAVSTPVPAPVNPLTGADVAPIVPVPVTPSDAPVPTNIAACVLVLVVSAENAVAPVDDAVTVTAPLVQVPPEHPEPVSVTLEPAINDVNAPPLNVCHPCADPPEFMPHT